MILNYIDNYLNNPIYEYKEVVIKKEPNGDVKEIIEKTKIEPLKVSEIKLLMELKEDKKEEIII